MNPYSQFATGIDAHHENQGLSWEMMVSEAAYRAFVALERVKDTIFATR